MQMSIKGLYPGTREFHVVDIFGYTTKGLPGLDIVGLSKLSRSIKEKIIFLTRQQGIALPLKRYVLCIEELPSTGNKAEEALRWLELPLLILFWSLAEKISFRNLHECLAMGKVAIDGKVTLYAELAQLEFNLEEVPHLFLKQTGMESDGHHFCLESLFETFPLMHFQHQNIDLDRKGFHQFHGLRQIL